MQKHTRIIGCDVEYDNETGQALFCWTHLIDLTKQKKIKKKLIRSRRKPFG